MPLRLPLLSIALILVVGLLAAGFNAAAGPPPSMPRPDPEGFARTPVGLVIQQPEASPGYTLFLPQDTGQPYLIDQQGRVVHSWQFDAVRSHIRLLENGNLMALAQGRRIKEVDPQSNVVWNYRVPGGHHDFIQLPGGNVLALAREQKSAAAAIAQGANPQFVPERGLRVDYIIEIRPTGPTGGEVVWQWSVWDHLIQDYDPAKPNYGVVADHPERVDLNYLLAAAKEQMELPGDWLHANSLDYNAELDQIVLSVRNLGELWIIDHSATPAAAPGSSGGPGSRGDGLLYRWGNPAAYRAGTDRGRQLHWAHHIQWIKPGLPGAGNILLFNNGDGYAGRQRLYSSIDEIALPLDGNGYRWPPESPEPRPLWTYTAKPPENWYSARQSGTQRLPNGNTLICDSRAGTIFEVTPGGRTVWQYVNPVTLAGDILRPGDLMPLDPRRSKTWQQEVWGNRLARAYRYSPDYPGLQYLDLTPGVPVELSGE